MVPKGYKCFNITNEETRTVHMKDFSFTIEQPVALVIRPGGSTHRVVNEFGETYCYAVPENGNSVISWTGYGKDIALKF